MLIIKERGDNWRKPKNYWLKSIPDPPPLPGDIIRGFDPSNVKRTRFTFDEKSARERLVKYRIGFTMFCPANFETRQNVRGSVSKEAYEKVKYTNNEWDNNMSIFIENVDNCYMTFTKENDEVFLDIFEFL